MMSEHFLVGIVSIPALLFGFFVIRYPDKVIDMQKRFYALINWRMEPISMQKEIRNTKVMGMILIAVVIFVCGYAFWK